MLTQVILETSDPMTFNIDAADPDEIVILKSISGLTPGDVNLFTGDFARNGGYYQGRRVGQRFPVFNLKLNENYVDDIRISDIREMLYRQFYEPQANSDGVQVKLVDDRKPDRYFIGYTDKWQGDIFSKDTSAQISTVCVDAFLQSVAETTLTTPGGWLTVPILYDGTADTGIELSLKVVGTTSTIVVENNDQTMVLEGSFVADDIVTINTIEGQRAIKLNDVDVMASLTAASDWLALKAANNLLKVYGSVAGDGKVVATSYTYRSAWWGV
jgi:hypothetical protein